MHSYRTNLCDHPLFGYKRLFDTLHKMFNAEIVRVDVKDLGILQGNKLSLLLCNITFTNKMKSYFTN
jgi:hypothetical protein